MKTISIKDFFEFGEFGHVQLGMLKQDVEAVLGYTDMVQHDNDFKVLTYGDGQFIFEDDVLICIQIETFKTCQLTNRRCICLGKNLKLNNEVFDLNQEQCFKYIKENLLAHDIKFSEELNDHGAKLIKLSSGVTLDFSFENNDNLIVNSEQNFEVAKLTSISHTAFY